MPSSPRLLLIVLLAVLVPIIPFVLFGDAIEAWVRSWLEPPPSPTTMVSLVIAVLATDIFLPNPIELCQHSGRGRAGHRRRHAGDMGGDDHRGDLRLCIGPLVRQAACRAFLEPRRPGTDGRCFGNLRADCADRAACGARLGRSQCADRGREPFALATIPVARDAEQPCDRSGIFNARAHGERPRMAGAGAGGFDHRAGRAHPACETVVAERSIGQ